jgi:uncharacterized Fe-S cluster protein YjdI
MLTFTCTLGGYYVKKNMDSNDREYTNGEITVYWRHGKCIHATNCYRELLEVFNPRKRPWINMKGAPTEQIIEVVNRCPTDALTYKWNDDKKNNEAINEKNEKIKRALTFASETTIRPVIIQVMKDGPLVVQGSFIIYDPAGNELKSMQMTSFCRCGASMSIPFCDGHHRKIGFKSDK